MRLAVFGLTAALMCFGAGCTRQKMTSMPTNTAHWRIQLLLAPRQPRQLDPVQFQVKISDKNWKPVSGAAVTVQLAMPAMDMGRNEIKLREAAPSGTYTGIGRFTMPGSWQVTVAAADKGAEHQSQTLSVSVQ